MHIVNHKYTDSWVQVTAMKWHLLCEKFSWVFLPQLLYHRSRGRKEECVPGFSFKLHDCKILKSNFFPYMHAVEKECIARRRKRCNLVMRPEHSAQCATLARRLYEEKVTHYYSSDYSSPVKTWVLVSSSLF